jgi:hypothetical protein
MAAASETGGWHRTWAEADQWLAVDHFPAQSAGFPKVNLLIPGLIVNGHRTPHQMCRWWTTTGAESFDSKKERNSDTDLLLGQLGHLVHGSEQVLLGHELRLHPSVSGLFGGWYAWGLRRVDRGVCELEGTIGSESWYTVF